MPTDYLDPLEALTFTDMTAVGTAGEPLPHEVLDDGVRQPAEPDLTDYAEAVATGGAIVLRMGTIAVAQVTEVTVWVRYALTGDPEAALWADLSISDDVEFFHGEVLVASVIEHNTSSGWGSATFGGLAATQADLDDMRVKLQFYNSNAAARIFAVYAEVTYGAPPAATRTVPIGVGLGICGPPTVF